MYLALIYIDDNFSFAVTIVSPESKNIVKSLSSKITEICLETNIPYPVAFFFDDMIIDEQYRIYPNKN